MKDAPSLRIDFTYDVVSNLFYAELENGAVIPVKLSDISGKLENTLTLFRRAVSQTPGGTPARQTDDDLLIAQAVERGLVQKVGVVKDNLLDW